MKILQLGKFYPIFGGVEKVMWDLTKGLSERGLECDMLCAGLKSEVEFDSSPKIIRFNDLGRVIVVKAIRKMAGTMLSPAMITYLRKHKGEYDIISIHHPDPMAALALYLSSYKGRVVLHWHSDIIKQKKLLKFYRPLQSWLIQRAECIVGTTPVYVEQSPELQGVKDKLKAVPIGVWPLEPDAKEVEKIRASFEGKKIIFSLGRLVPYKGYTYLLQAAKLLPSDYQVVIGGNGPLLPQLERQIIDLGIKDRVSLLGRVPDEVASALFGASDVFVLPSIQKTEAFGIVQVEAMSCGVPVVATKIPQSGTAWVNEDGVSGLNVEPEDPKALADAIVSICEGDYESFRKGAKQRYEAQFTIESMINKVLDIYEKN